MAIRIKDIATALNVSSATVSLVLNNKPGVKEETREKILQYVSAAGYKMKSLIKPTFEKNGTVLFIVYKKHGRVVSDTPFFSQLIEGIECETRNNRFGLSILYVDETDGFPEIVQQIKENSPDGIILLATEMYKCDILNFMEINVPIVILDNCFHDLKIDTVVIDNVYGVCEAITYLIENGHTNIGYLHGSADINNFKERELGFKKAHADSGLKLLDSNIYELESTQTGAYLDMKNALRSDHSLPTAFFCDNDIIAAGAIKALKDHGIQLPEDISIVGFDNMPFSDMIEPALTTVGVYKQKMGMLAVSRLIYRINAKPDEYVKVFVGTSLIKRASVANKKDA